MKSKKVLSVLVCLLMACCFVCFGCGKDDDSTDKAIAVIDGFRIESISVFNIYADYYNIEIGIKNTNEESATFDYTQIHIIFNDSELEHNGDDMLFEVNQYWKMSLQISVGDSNLSVGDKVDVYYQDKLLKTVEVTEL